MAYIATIATPIATEARDLLPETWQALAAADSFGPPALERRHDRVVRKIFGEPLDTNQQEALDDVVVEYVGKLLAFNLIGPAIDYWSKQSISHTAGEQESEAFKDRVEDLKELRKLWIAELAQLYLDVEVLLPVRAGRARDMPRVIQAGETVAHVTAQIDDIEPLYGPPEGTAGTGTGA